MNITSSTINGTLHLVATPIGNLGDLTSRAIEVLGSAALVCCEDTRRTGKLFHHAGIRARKMVVCNEHTETNRIEQVLAVLAEGHDVAIVSDAGTPGLSDPGERIVRAALDAGYRVSPVPGPVAAVAALVISGLPSGRFVFEGFLPRRGPDRKLRLATVAAETRTTVLYEAPHRIQRTIADLAEVCGGQRRVAVARELTKLYEETLRGTLAEIDLGEPRGEYVIVLDGAEDRRTEPDEAAIRAALRDEIAEGSTTRDAVAAVAKSLGAGRREVYAVALELNKEDP
jgi:16S rRNA (cytidine1402-2'-O)-methyltransferase